MLVDLFLGDHKAAPHLARQPFGVVPALDDDGFVLFESRASLRHLDRRFPSPPLTPTAPREIARMDQWISVDQSYIAPHTRALATERIVKKRDARAADPVVERVAEGALGAALAVIDRALATSRYLAGDTFSLADISLMPYVASLPMVGAEHLRADLPHLAAWWAGVQLRPSWRKVAAH